MLASVRSATLTGVDGHVVTVEVHVSTGLPSYHVVGLPDAAVRESRERASAALLSSHLRVPATADHGQPRAGWGSQDRRGFELASPSVSSPPRASSRTVACSTRWACSASSGSTDQSAWCPASSHSSARCAAGTGSVIVPATDVAEASLVHGMEARSARSVAELRAA